MSEQTSQFHGSYAKFPAASEIVALVLAVIPFCANFTTTSTHTVNGRVVESSYIDYVAIPCGILAILLGLYSLTKLKDTADSDRIKRIGAIVVIVLLGGYQTLSGFGVFHTPSAPTSAGPFPTLLSAEVIATKMATTMPRRRPAPPPPQPPRGPLRGMYKERRLTSRKICRQPLKPSQKQLSWTRNLSMPITNVAGLIVIRVLTSKLLPTTPRSLN